MPAYPDYLDVRDSRTSRVYKIPIDHNAVTATDFQKIKDHGNQGLKIYDPGLANTAPLMSGLTYMYVSTTFQHCFMFTSSKV
jgi:citrate synthase